MRRPRVPITLPLIALILLILGLVANALLPSLTTAEQRADNVLLAAIPFILVFVGILLFYITLITLTATAFSDMMNPRLHQAVLRLIIAGILGGILAMFQPWARMLYTWGFVVLLVSTLSYILWSHIRPARLPAADEASA
jgi:hypothetical protein